MRADYYEQRKAEESQRLSEVQRIWRREMFVFVGIVVGIPAVIIGLTLWWRR